MTCGSPKRSAGALLPSSVRLGWRGQPVADGLQRGGVVAGRESVEQFGEAGIGVSDLMLGALVPVEPDLPG